ncbi:MAG: SDR family oxidoreductase [Deltaproteobacteria bacterium]|nr:SDR family oxidoreductase [Deltaproteobacteria bacterium]
MGTEPLAGRTALVTGASRGIGRAVAERLAQDGARIVASARSVAALEEVVRSLPGAGHVALPMDVGDAASIESALAGLLDVDILVSNAGIAESKPFDRTDDATFLRLFEVNALATARLARVLIPRMVARGFGRVVVVASNAGLSGYAYTSAYCASKHAVVGWMRAVAHEIARTPVTVNAVCPGWVDTDMAGEAVSRIAVKTGRSAEDARSTLAAMSPQHRLVAPEEVAHLVASLCHEHARSIHGQALAQDGGQLMR